MYLFINGWAADASVWESLHPGEDCRFLEFSAGLEPGGVVREAAALAAEIHGVKKNALYKYALEQQGE